MKAGKETEVAIDFSDRGGILMISRRISPRRTRSRRSEIASRNHSLTKVWPGDRVVKVICKKARKSSRNRAWRTRASFPIGALLGVGLRGRIEVWANGLLQIFVKDRAVFGRKLAEMKCGLLRSRVAIGQC